MHRGKIAWEAQTLGFLESEFKLAISYKLREVTDVREIRRVMSYKIENINRD